MNPSTVEQFKQFEEALVKKLSTLEASVDVGDEEITCLFFFLLGIQQTSPHFVRFLEDLMRRVGAPSKSFL